MGVSVREDSQRHLRYVWRGVGQEGIVDAYFYSSGL